MIYKRAILFCCYTICSIAHAAPLGDLPTAVASFTAAEQKWNAADFKICAERFRQLHAQAPNEQSAYWTAVADFHLAQAHLYGTADIRDKTKGSQALERCINALEIAVVQYPQNAEMQAMLSSALGMRMGEKPLSALTQGHRVGALMDRAMALDSLNPRVRYLYGVNLVFTPELFGGGAAAGRVQLQRASQLFEQESRTKKTNSAPTWGAVPTAGFVALSWLREDKPQSALVAAQQCLQANPRNNICRAVERDAQEELK